MLKSYQYFIGMLKKCAFLLLLTGCASPDIQYRYICRPLYLSSDAYDRIAGGENGAADIDRLFEHEIWCEQINNGGNE